MHALIRAHIRLIRSDDTRPPLTAIAIDIERDPVIKAKQLMVIRDHILIAIV